MAGNGGGPGCGNSWAPETDLCDEQPINSKPTARCATAQTPHQLGHAIAVHSGRACIGYVHGVDRAVVALDHDGIEIGKYESRRLAFSAVSENNPAEVGAR